MGEGFTAPPLTLKQLQKEATERYRAFYEEGWTADERINNDNYWYVTGYYDVLTNSRKSNLPHLKSYNQGMEDAKGDLELLTYEEIVGTVRNKPNRKEAQ